jgi:phenylalanyl-tRNA synthetase beta chain
MKLPLSLLKQFIDLPKIEEHTLRSLFDELGLEVEEVLQEKGETFFKLETLAHRGDHLYALGIARELSAHFLKPIRDMIVSSTWKVGPLTFPVVISTDKCRGYLLLQVELPEKIMISHHIERCMPEMDMEKHPLVHLLNYAFMEIGQPLHAFDKEAVRGAISVCESTKEETIIALDGKKYTVPQGSLLIKDEEKILAVAGVIGCANSMITPKTRQVLLESATFDPVSVRKTAKKMGLSTDASYAFERGCDSEARLPALKRVIMLLQEMSGSPEEDLHLRMFSFSREEKKLEIQVSFDVLRQQTNIPSLENEEIIERLLFLGYSVEPFSPAIYRVVPPSWRQWNVLTEGAVLEDWMRVYGFNRLPLQLPPVDMTSLPVTPNENLLEKLENTFLGNGFFEVVTKSYYSSESLSCLKTLDPFVGEKHISIKNSIDKENAYLKVTNCIHLAQLADYNLRKGVLAVKIYEFARLFGRDNKPENSIYSFERDVFSFAISGRWYESEWKKGETVEEKLFLFKGLLEAFFQRLDSACSFSTSNISYLHPGCQASIFIQGKRVGFLGMIHPQLKTGLDLLDDVVYAELDTASIVGFRPKSVKEEISEYPSIKRDVTFMVKEDSRAEEVCEHIFSIKPSFLHDITIRDAFKKNEEAFRRVTYRLHFQSPLRTLAHEEVDVVMADLLVKMKENFYFQMA